MSMSIIDSQEPVYRAEHEIDELQAKVYELTAKNRALERELKMARGEVKTVLNNCEGAKLKAEREAEKYRTWMEQSVDEMHERELKRANEGRDFWHTKYDDLARVVTDAVKFLNGRGKYVVVEVNDRR